MYPNDRDKIGLQREAPGGIIYVRYQSYKLDKLEFEFSPCYRFFKKCISKHIFKLEIFKQIKQN